VEHPTPEANQRDALLDRRHVYDYVLAGASVPRHRRCQYIDARPWKWWHTWRSFTAQRVVLAMLRMSLLLGAATVGFRRHGELLRSLPRTILVAPASGGIPEDDAVGARSSRQPGTACGQGLIRSPRPARNLQRPGMLHCHGHRVKKWLLDARAVQRPGSQPGCSWIALYRRSHAHTSVLRRHQQAQDICNYS